MHHVGISYFAKRNFPRNLPWNSTRAIVTTYNPTNYQLRVNSCKHGARNDRTSDNRSSTLSSKSKGERAALLLACTTLCAACRPTWHAGNVLIFPLDRKQRADLYESSPTPEPRKQFHGWANRYVAGKRTP